MRAKALSGMKGIAPPASRRWDRSCRECESERPIRKRSCDVSCRDRRRVASSEFDATPALKQRQEREIGAPMFRLQPLGLSQPFEAKHRIAVRKAPGAYAPGMCIMPLRDWHRGEAGAQRPPNSFSADAHAGHPSTSGPDNAHDRCRDCTAS